MTHAKILEFLRVRDRAYARGDNGVIRSMNFELRRLGIRDDATLAHPEGKPARIPTDPDPAPKPRQRQMRCEHNNVAERCAECDPSLLAAS